MSQQFDQFRASELYCAKCKKAMPVRERLLLVLPDKEIFDYLCTGCAESLGQREVTAGDRHLQALAQRRAQAQASANRLRLPGRS